MAKAWFIVHWDIEGAHLDGPFGDSKDDAIAHAKEGLKNGEYESAAVTSLELERVEAEETADAAAG